MRAPGMHLQLGATHACECETTAAHLQTDSGGLFPPPLDLSHAVWLHGFLGFRVVAPLAGIAGNVVLVTALMHVCQRGGQPARAMRIFRAAEAEGLPLDVVRWPLA